MALATRAEAAGLRFALISDHFHPWADAQGQSPFVWAVLGQRWPPVALRQAMLAEAVEVIRALWQGTPVTIRGRF